MTRAIFTTPQGAMDDSKVNVIEQEVGNNMNNLNFDAVRRDCNSKSPLMKRQKKKLTKYFRMKVTKAKHKISQGRFIFPKGRG